MSAQPIHPWRAVDDAVVITRAELEPGVLGWWDGDVGPAGEIVVSRASDQAEARCTVRHEWHHSQRGDRRLGAHEHPAADWVTAKDELAVARATARDMITMPGLLDALLWSQDEVEIAEWLWVDVATLRDRIAALTSQESRWLSDAMLEREAHIP